MTGPSLSLTSLPRTARADSASAPRGPATESESEIKSKSGSQAELQPFTSQQQQTAAPPLVLLPFTASQAARCAQHRAHGKACRILQKQPPNVVSKSDCFPLRCQRYGRRRRRGESRRRRGKGTKKKKNRKRKKRMLYFQTMSQKRLQASFATSLLQK